MATDWFDEKWAAGFFDGEGCIHIARNLRLIVSGVFRPGLLEMYQARWGGRIAPSRTTKPGQRQGVRWEITGPRAADCLRDLQPYLFEKQEQAVVALRYIELKRQFNVRGGKGYTAEQRDAFTPYEQELRRLKVVEKYPAFRRAS